MSELYHYGIKGMKWGVRRTPEQLGRRIKIAPYTSKNEAKRRPELTPERTQQKRNTLNESRRIINESRNVADVVSRERSSSKTRDLSNMTDQQLRDAINRMNLEQQYRNLTAQQISKGESYLRDVLDVGGSVLGVTGSILGIALAIKQLRE